MLITFNLQVAATQSNIGFAGWHVKTGRHAFSVHFLLMSLLLPGTCTSASGLSKGCGKTGQVSYLFVFRLKPEQLAHLGVPASLIRGLLRA